MRKTYKPTSASVSLTNPLIEGTIVRNLYIDLSPSIPKDDTIDINSIKKGKSLFFYSSIQPDQNS